MKELVNEAFWGRIIGSQRARGGRKTFLIESFWACILASEDK